MRLLAIVLFHVRFTRVHDTVMNKKRERESEREREMGRIILINSIPVIQSSNAIVISSEYQSTTICC